VINLIHRGTSPIVQEQNSLSPVADEVEIGEESPFSTDLLQAEGTMRVKHLTVGIAVLVAVGIWQVRADQESGTKKKSSPDSTDLIKHGEYLVSQVAHCGDCHTPRDAKGEPDPSKLLQGTTLGVVPKHKTEHWADESPAITGGGLAGEWSEEEMIEFLTTGVNPHGEKPTPPMPVFRLHKRDARAVTLYLKSLPGKEGSGDGAKKSNPD
jgi:mono/diheme cytochrome c family protein